MRRFPPRPGLIYGVFGSLSDQVLASQRLGMEHTFRTLDPAPSLVVVAESFEGEPAWEAWCRDRGIVHLPFPTGPRHRGLWQKEALWDLASAWLHRQHPEIRRAVFLDMDLEPEAIDWLAQIDQTMDEGVMAFQPWSTAHDTVESDIGGISRCWQMMQHLPPPGQPGFSWALELSWLRAAGGWRPCSHPLGGADTIASLSWLQTWGPLPPMYPWMVHEIVTYTGPKVPPRGLDVHVIHNTHGPASARSYPLRSLALTVVARHPSQVVEQDGTGLLCTRDNLEGRAFSLFLARREGWNSDPETMGRLWKTCLEESRTAP